MKKFLVIGITLLTVLVVVGFASDKNNEANFDEQKNTNHETLGNISTTTSGWVTWKKNVSPVYSGPHHLVGDPSVIRDGEIYRMFYNCYDTEKSWGAICQVTSPDGLAWTEVPTNDTLVGRMILTRGDDKWDTAHETPFVYKHNGEYLLYFTGYVHKGDFGKSFPYHIGLATSYDGVHFERFGDGPIFSPTKGGYDSDAVFSPTIVEFKGKLTMLYTGMCVSDCSMGAGVTLLAATSADGKVWTKVSSPVITKEQVVSVFPEAKDGVAESDIVKGPDGYFYLFMSLLYGDNGHEIGVARSITPYGPWDINPETIIKKTKGAFDSVGPIAPSVIFENGKSRMWFHGFGIKNIDIGYAETIWPLVQK